MRHFSTLLRHELRMLLTAPAAWTAGTLFLLLTGALWFFIILDYSKQAQEVMPAVTFFGTFWLPMFLLVPLLTMKSLAGERGPGTLETLLATPVTVLEVVMAKFWASWLFYIVLWVLGCVFPFVARVGVRSAAGADFLVGMQPMVGGLCFVGLIGLPAIALGVLASSLTRSQVVAGLLASALVFVLVLGGRLLGELPLPEIPGMDWLQGSCEAMQVFRWLEDFTAGIVDTRGLVMAGGVAILALGVTVWVVDSHA